MFSLIKSVLTAQRHVVKRISAGVIGLALVMAVAAILYNYGLGLYRSVSLATLTKYPHPASDDSEAIEWINSHAGASDVLICYRDPLYYLYTGRKAVRSSSPRHAGSLQSSAGNTEADAKAIFKIADENKARYLIFTKSDFGLDYQPDAQRQRLRDVIDQNPKVFVPLFESANGDSTIYRIEGN
jgi:hypothetical protein